MSNELFLDTERINKAIDSLIDDVPDFDGGDFYTDKNTGRRYGSWRTKVDSKTESYLRGYKDGLEAVKKVMQGQGGSTIWGIAHTACPYELIKYSERMKEAGSYNLGGTHCECDKCLADIKRVDDANPRMCDCDAEYLHPDCAEHGAAE